MDDRTKPERRRSDRRWRERRQAAHPVFLDTRLPNNRRAGERRRLWAETEPVTERQPR